MTGNKKVEGSCGYDPKKSSRQCRLEAGNSTGKIGFSPIESFSEKKGEKLLKSHSRGPKGKRGMGEGG